MNFLYDISAVEIGQHFYWSLGGFQMHGQVLINSWIVLGLIIAFAVTTTRDLKPVPEGGQNLAEFVVEYIRDIAKTQVGSDYLECCLLYTSPSPRDMRRSRMPSSA